MIAFASSSRPPRGQVLVIAAFAMIVLVSMAGLAIDGGRGYWEKRQAQNAAEHAALAAAWEFCNPDDPANPQPSAAAIEAATDNGFTHDGVTTWVELSGVSGAYTVDVRSKMDTAFAGLMGFETITASGRAVADCRTTSGGGYALFAGGDWCPSGKNMLQVSGSDNVITGKIHSNRNIYVSGQDNEFNDGTTYVSTITRGVNTFNPDAQPSSILPWPVTFTAAEYRAMAQSGEPKMFFKTGDMDWSWIDSKGGEGLFYATGKIDIGVGGRAANLTLVSESEVVISGSSNNLTPYMDNLLAFSTVAQPANDRCDKQGVTMSGSDNRWTGFIYAPLSNIKMDGSTGSTLSGSLIGWSINLSGSALNNTADPSFFAGPPVLRLVE